MNEDWLVPIDLAGVVTQAETASSAELGELTGYLKTQIERLQSCLAAVENTLKTALNSL